MGRFLKPLFLVAVSLSLVAAVSGCGSQASAPAPTKSSSSSNIVVGFTANNVGADGYQTIYSKILKQDAGKLGVKLVALDPRGDAATQLNQIEDLIQQKVSVILLWPTNGKAVIPALKKAQAAGIPVVVTNTEIDPSGNTYIKGFSGPSCVQEGQVAGQEMAKALNGKGNVVEIVGTPGYTTSIQRQQGFEDVIKKYPNIKILDVQPANGDRVKAMQVMQDYLTRFKNIDGVFAMDDNLGIGAVQAIKSAGRQNEIKVVGAGCFGVGYDAIAKGNYYGSVYQSPTSDAQNALQMAVNVAQGKPVTFMNYFKTTPITHDNYTQFPRPTW